MAGHSHWKNIKVKKGAADAKRGKLFSKLSRLIIVAARQGGGDPDTNLRLRYAIDKAKAVSMPANNIDRAVKKGTGELDTGHLDEVVYEGYGVNGVAILCEAMTDNRNRTAGEARKAFEVHGGKMGTSGCVAWMFNLRGVLVVEAQSVDEDHLLEVAIEAGADDVKYNDSQKLFEVSCEPQSLRNITQSLNDSKIAALSADLAQIPSTFVDLDAESGRKVLRLVEALDEMDDIQSVYANYNIPDDIMAEIAS